MRPLPSYLILLLHLRPRPPTHLFVRPFRIGRTGRCGKTGIATTFINKNCEETILLDLKHLLLEAKQRVPMVLSSIIGEDVAVEEIGGVKGCAFCGGLGHRIAACPKRAHATQKQAAGTSSREVLTGGDY
jgi:ATP-dependent RNA helicase DDX41